MKIIKGDLVLKENTTFDEDLTVEGNIRCEGGLWNLICGDLNCWNLNCWDLDCRNLTCGDLNCRNLNCRDLNCWDLNCWNLNCWNLNCWNLICWDLNFYAFAIAYSSFKCKSWKARRDNYVIKCLDGEIEIIKKVCDKCGKELEK
jgi:hypothetical protein